MNKNPILVCFALFIMAGCSSEETILENTSNNDLYFPPVNTEFWETVSPMDLNWNIESMAELEQFLIGSGTKAFLILKNGKIAVEGYYNDFSREDRHPWFSAGKTLTAFTIGLAQQDGFLSIDDQTSKYLGKGWTNMPVVKEDLITIRHQLTMTSGGDYSQGNIHCTDPNCLRYFADAGTSWYYHNAFYTLLQPVLENALPNAFDSYFNQNLRSKIGMTGFWVESGYNRFYFSNARSMARFGLLNLNKGNWNGIQLLNETFFNEMVNTSQILNEAYGYLWWLNGKQSKRLPGFARAFDGKLIENAPDDLIAGMGANDQKLYVIPSENLVIIRLGDDGGTSNLGPSTYDNQLWEKLNKVLFE